MPSAQSTFNNPTLFTKFVFRGYPSYTVCNDEKVMDNSHCPSYVDDKTGDQDALQIWLVIC